jgi:hypothetical protein
MTAIRRTNHVDQAVSRMLDVSRKPFFAALLGARIKQLQETEDAVWEVFDNLNLDFAIGIWLDWIGKIVGRGRRGLTDDEAFRHAIRTQIRINRSSGVTQDWLDVANLAFTGTWSIHDYPPASAIVSVAEPITGAQRDEIVFDLSQIRAAGTRVDLDYSVAHEDQQGRFGWDGSATGALGLGWDGDVTLGGRASDVVIV